MKNHYYYALFILGASVIMGAVFLLTAAMQGGGATSLAYAKVAAGCAALLPFGLVVLAFLAERAIEESDAKRS